MKRRNRLTIQGKTEKYIHKSARFTGLMSDIGIERIGDYVRSMEYHANVLAEMVRTGIINNRTIVEEVASITRESEQTESDITLINNSLLRFLHADTEKIKGIPPLTEQAGKPGIPENAERLESLNSPLPDEAAQAAITTGDSRE